MPGATVPGATVLARVAGSNEPVVCLIPHGAGRILVSGALDAWRYRADKDSAFDRFWRSAIAGVALATPPAVDVEIAPAVARPGESVRIVARVHRSALRCWRRRPASGFRTARFGRAGSVMARSGSGRLQRIVRRRPPAEASKAGQAGVQRITVSAGADGAEGTTGSAVMAVDPVCTSRGAPCSAVVARDFARRHRRLTRSAGRPRGLPAPRSQRPACAYDSPPDAIGVVDRAVCGLSLR